MPMLTATSTNETPPAPVYAAICKTLMRSYWVAASGIHGNPPNSQVRVHSTITHAPARPSIAASRTGVGLPIILGMAHHAARNHEPVQAPTSGPRRNSPAHVTGWSQLRLTVQATAWAINMVHAKTLSLGRMYTQNIPGTRHM